MSDKPTNLPPSPPAAPSAASTSPTTVKAEGLPGVIRIKAPKGKRKYSRDLKDLQRAQRGFNKASARISRALASGLTTFERRSDASSRKKRDGAIKDALDNWARAASKTLRKASDAPRDLIRPLDTKRTRRQMRDIAKIMARLFYLR